MNYLTHEIAFDLPGLTMDRSINVLTLADPQQGTPFQVILNRDELLAGETLPQSFERQVGLMTRQVQSFKILARQAGPVGPQDIQVIGIESRFTQAGKNYHQLQALFVTEPPRLMVLTLSSHAPLGPGPREVWMDLLNSLRLRGGEPALPSVPVPPAAPA